MTLLETMDALLGSFPIYVSGPPTIIAGPWATFAMEPATVEIIERFLRPLTPTEITAALAPLREVA